MVFKGIYMKRGVSPLIAWVLIVGFAVVMGAFIFSWATGTLKDLNIGESQEYELYCDNVELRINNVCTKDDGIGGPVYIYPNFTNVGNYDITRLTITLENENRALGSCDIPERDIIENNGFNDLGGLEHGFQVGMDYSFWEASVKFITLNTGRAGELFSDIKTCDYVDISGLDEEDLTYFAVTPWIKVDKEESFPCSNKEAILDGRGVENIFNFRMMNTDCPPLDEDPG